MDTSLKRNSSFELLRILCIGGIACMHALAGICGNPKFGYLVIAENAIFNIGVTCFILISGYFGVKWSFPKFLRLNLLAVFASLIDLGFRFYNTHTLAPNDLLRAAFPVFTARWWFLSCYVCLMMLAPFLDMLLERISKRDFQILLLILLLWFYISPTFLYFQLMSDAGKGLANFLTVYLIGRYIRKYHDPFERPRLSRNVLTVGGGYSNNIVPGYMYGEYPVCKSF